MNVCNFCSKFWLILINILVFLIGGLFIAAGIIIMVGLDVVRTAFDSVLKALPDVVREAGFVDVVNKGFQTGKDLELDVVLGPAAIAFIVVGIILILIAVFGCCGACLHSVCMLSTYAAVIIFLILLEIVLVILLFAAATRFETEARTIMKKSIQSEYEGIRGTNGLTLVWNFGQLFYKCCGANNYEDFYSAVKWNRTVMVNDTQENQVKQVTLGIPLACCKMNGTFPSVKPLDPQCAQKPTDQNSNRKTGCYQRIVELVKDNGTYMIIAGVILFAFELLVVIMAVSLLCTKRHEDEKMGPV